MPLVIAAASGVVRTRSVVSPLSRPARGDAGDSRRREGSAEDRFARTDPVMCSPNMSPLYRRRAAKALAASIPVPFERPTQSATAKTSPWFRTGNVTTIDARGRGVSHRGVEAEVFDWCDFWNPLDIADGRAAEDPEVAIVARRRWKTGGRARKSLPKSSSSHSSISMPRYNAWQPSTCRRCPLGTTSSRQPKR